MATGRRRICPRAAAAAVMLGSAVAGFIVSAAADSAEPVARGDSAYANRQLNEAIAHYSEALKESPRDLRALSHLTRAESEQSESEKGDTRDRLAASAVAHARTAVEVAPDSSVSHVWLAVALGRQALHAGPHAKLGMAREIKSEADRAIALDPRNARAYHVRALWNREIATLSFLERSAAGLFGGVPKGATLANAASDLEKAVALQPNYVNHHYELGRTYAVLHRTADARREFETGISLPPVSSALDSKIQDRAREALAKLPKSK